MLSTAGRHLNTAVPAGSAAYAISELVGWKAGLSSGFREARGFYLIIAVATGIGTLMSVFDFDPIKIETEFVEITRR